MLFLSMNTITQLKAELEQLGVASKSEFFPRFFKTGKGEYGEGDQFWGVTVPNIRLVAKRYYQELNLAEIKGLIYDPIHEVRLLAAIVLVMKYKKADSDEKSEIYSFYVLHSKQMNNWDIVDSSARDIVGAYLWQNNGELSILTKFASSDNLWQNRIAIIASWYFIKQGEYQWTIELAEKYLSHKHDLIHKATGWMLRELGKQSEKTLLAFLDEHAQKMPRTMLRYAIERLSPTQQKNYLLVKS